jgi:hypothetical protein
MRPFDGHAPREQRRRATAPSDFWSFDCNRFGSPNGPTAPGSDLSRRRSHDNAWGAVSLAVTGCDPRRLRFERGRPRRIYCDNGNEFVIVADWIYG